MILIKQAEVYCGRRSDFNGPQLTDVRCAGGRIVAIDKNLDPLDGEIVIEANGGALLPGLHDHHIHLMALTAAGQSLICGPPAVNSGEQLGNALQGCGGSGWIRGVAYHESVAGMLHRKQLDEWVVNRPLRIQHRSGKMWFVNSLAAKLLKLSENRHLDGIEVDDDNEPTGRLFRMDEWLRGQLNRAETLDVKATSSLLASFGVTSVTDATVNNNDATWNFYQKKIDSGEVLQRVLLMGDESLISIASGANWPLAETTKLLERGILKILLDDAALPDFYQLTQRIVRAHELQCAVAIHCVTTVELVFALAVCEEAGHFPGDRIEHGSVVDDSALEVLYRSGMTVVTQPNFIAERGDQYAIDVDTAQQPFLYRVKTLLDAGIPVGGSTDAPYGNPDPWCSINAAVHRKTPTGAKLGELECVSPEQALRLFTSPASNPGGPMVPTIMGAVADLCLLDRPWREARLRLQHEDVKMTVRGGEIIYRS